MLGTKELLQQQRESKPPEIKIRRIAQGKTLDWDFLSVAQALRCNHQSTTDYCFGNNRVLSPLLALWMSCHGFDARGDKKGGYFLISKSTKAVYRLCVGIGKMDLTPVNKQKVSKVQEKLIQTLGQTHGWAIIITSDLPTAPIWFLADRTAEDMRIAGVLDSNYRGLAASVRHYLEAQV